MAKTPINTRFFHVSQIGIYRYTDDLHIQKGGKGRKKRGRSGRCEYKRGGHRIRIWDVSGRWPSTWTAKKRNAILLYYLYYPRYPASIPADASPRQRCAC